jgi:hypothetical protein
MNNTVKFMKRTLTLIALILHVFHCFPANDNISSDAPSMGVGNASVVYDNIYGSFNNQAVLASISNLEIASSYSNRFSLSTVQVMAAIPFEFGVVEANVSRYGSASYAEMKFGVGFARKFGEMFSASLQMDLLSVMMSPTEGSAYALTGEIGLWAHPLKDLTLGFHLYNFVNAHYKTTYYEESVPVNMKLGLGYTIFDNFRTTVEVENNSIYGTSVRGGVEYKIIDAVMLRTGGASNPALVSIGLGVVFQNFKFDIAAQAVRHIGKTGGVSLSYSFR